MVCDFSWLMLSELSLVARFLLAQQTRRATLQLLSGSGMCASPAGPLTEGSQASSSTGKGGHCGGRRHSLIFIAVEERKRLWNGEDARCLFLMTTAQAVAT